MDSLVRGFPAAVLLVTGLFGLVLGPLLPYAASANNGPNSGQISIEMVQFGAALFIGGVAFVWVAWGVWRSKLWRTRLAMFFAVAALAHLAAALPRSLTPIAFSFDEAGRAYPHYDGRSDVVVISIVLYSVALVCLLAAEHRQTTAVARPDDPSAPADH